MKKVSSIRKHYIFELSERDIKNNPNLCVGTKFVLFLKEEYLPGLGLDYNSVDYEAETYYEAKNFAVYY